MVINVIYNFSFRSTVAEFDMDADKCLLMTDYNKLFETDQNPKQQVQASNIKPTKQC